MAILLPSLIASPKKANILRIILIPPGVPPSQLFDS